MQKKDWGGPIGLGSPGLQKLHYAAQKDLAQRIEKELGNNSGGSSSAKVMLKKEDNSSNNTIKTLIMLNVMVNIIFRLVTCTQ